MALTVPGPVLDTPAPLAAAADGKGYWRCGQPDGSYLEVRHRCVESIWCQ